MAAKCIDFQIQLRCDAFNRCTLTAAYWRFYTQTTHTREPSFCCSKPFLHYSGFHTGIPPTSSKAFFHFSPPRSLDSHNSFPFLPSLLHLTYLPPPLPFSSLSSPLPSSLPPSSPPSLHPSYPTGLSTCVYPSLMYHKFADTVTLESARPRNQRSALTAEGGISSLFPSSSPLLALPTMPFAYGRCHRGAGPCQLRVTCPLPLLYVIIQPICSAQQGLLVIMR